MNRGLLALIAWTFVCCGLAAGQGCIVRNRVFAAQAAAVVTPAVVATPAVVVPSYGASYDGSAVEVQTLKEKLAAVEARLATLETALRVTSPVATPKAEPAAAKGAESASVGSLPAAVARSCIQCHGAKSPKGGLALVDATGKKLAALTCEQRLEVLRRINLEGNDPAVMPPKGKGEPVSDKEAAELLEAMTKPTK